MSFTIIDGSESVTGLPHMYKSARRIVYETAVGVSEGSGVGDGVSLDSGAEF